VIFTGTLPNALQMYPIFDLYVAASRKEGLSLSLIEAMAMGLPVVATDVPGHRDVVVHGETGMLVPPGDTPALAHAVASVLSDSAARKAMSEAGRRRAHQKFALRATVEATAQVYRQAAARAQRSQSERTTGDGWPGV
jgi:glycosyltransferase involved in cell wall biosynthesis